MMAAPVLLISLKLTSYCGRRQSISPTMVNIVVKLMAVLILTGVRFADLISGLSDDEEVYIFQELVNQDEDVVRQQERNQDLPHRCRSGEFTDI